MDLQSPVVVSLISDHVIPPCSQCFVHAGSADYGPDNQDALFSPFMDEMARLGILVGAGVVIAGPQNQIPVTVMNNSELPVKLFAGTRIGVLSSKGRRGTPGCQHSDSQPATPTKSTKTGTSGRKSGFL